MYIKINKYYSQLDIYNFNNINLTSAFLLEYYFVNKTLQIKDVIKYNINKNNILDFKKYLLKGINNLSKEELYMFLNYKLFQNNMYNKNHLYVYNVLKDQNRDLFNINNNNQKEILYIAFSNFLNYHSKKELIMMYNYFIKNKHILQYNIENNLFYNFLFYTNINVQTFFELQKLTNYQINNINKYKHYFINKNNFSYLTTKNKIDLYNLYAKDMVKNISNINLINNYNITNVEYINNNNYIDNISIKANNKNNNIQDKILYNNEIGYVYHIQNRKQYKHIINNTYHSFFINEQVENKIEMYEYIYNFLIFFYLDKLSINLLVDILSIFNILKFDKLYFLIKNYLFNNFKNIYIIKEYFDYFLSNNIVYIIDFINFEKETKNFKYNQIINDKVENINEPIIDYNKIFIKYLPSLDNIYYDIYTNNIIKYNIKNICKIYFDKENEIDNDDFNIDVLKSLSMDLDNDYENNLIINDGSDDDGDDGDDGGDDGDIGDFSDNDGGDDDGDGDDDDGDDDGDGDGGDEYNYIKNYVENENVIYNFLDKMDDVNKMVELKSSLTNESLNVYESIQNHNFKLYIDNINNENSNIENNFDYVMLLGNFKYEVFYHLNNFFYNLPIKINNKYYLFNKTSSTNDFLLNEKNINLYFNKSNIKLQSIFIKIINILNNNVNSKIFLKLKNRINDLYTYYEKNKIINDVNYNTLTNKLIINNYKNNNLNIYTQW